MILLTDGGWGGILAAAVVAAVIITFLVSQWFFKRQIDKNPPINEAMIREMYRSVGRKPSEADIQRTLNAIYRQNKKK